MELSVVCDRFELGIFRARQTVAGGRSNELYRVDTDRGAFAVKRLLANAHAVDFEANMGAAYAIEARAFAGGVPMPEPVPDPRTGGALAWAAGDWWRVHRWVDALRIDTPTTVDAADAGVLLARIQRVGVMASDGTVGSHTDLDPKNTLRAADGVLLAVDWDAAGQVCPAEEAVQVALDWALESDHVDTDRFVAVVAAYSAAGGPEQLRPERKVFAGWLRAYQNWLEFNQAQRMDTELGRREAETTRARIALVTAALDDLVRLLSKDWPA